MGLYERIAELAISAPQKEPPTMGKRNVAVYDRDSIRYIPRDEIRHLSPKSPKEATKRPHSPGKTTERRLRLRDERKKLEAGDVLPWPKYAHPEMPNSLPRRDLVEKGTSERLAWELENAGVARDTSILNEVTQGMTGEFGEIVKEIRNRVAPKLDVDSRDKTVSDKERAFYLGGMLAAPKPI